MVPNSHFGSLLKGILIPWNLAIFSATSAEMLGSLNSEVSSLRLCQQDIVTDYFIRNHDHEYIEAVLSNIFM